MHQINGGRKRAFGSVFGFYRDRDMFKFDFDIEADFASSKVQKSSDIDEIGIATRSSDAPDEYAEISLIELVRIRVIVNDHGLTVVLARYSASCNIIFTPSHTF
jgi:hypothetical protein